jgi:hypothetical protein
MAGPSITDFRGHGGVYIDAYHSYPRWQHVPHSDRVQHGTQAQDNASLLQLCRVGVLRFVHVGDAIRQRTVIPQTACEYERYVRLYTVVHDAPRETTGFNSVFDASGVVDSVDGSHVIAVPVLLLPAVRDPDAKRSPEEC